MDVAVGAEGEGDGVLGDGLGGVGGDAGDLHADGLREVDVYGVKSGTAHEDEANAKATENL